ncbi:hypothetical protein EV126DRAFT_79893 [Verticillium dahliae]|nr:hypothetical protein EV126DRAFT_79893 [Verticillium dahliae]
MFRFPPLPRSHPFVANIVQDCLRLSAYRPSHNLSPQHAVILSLQEHVSPTPYSRTYQPDVRRRFLSVPCRRVSARVAHLRLLSSRRTWWSAIAEVSCHTECIFAAGLCLCYFPFAQPALSLTHSHPCSLFSGDDTYGGERGGSGAALPDQVAGKKRHGLCSCHSPFLLFFFTFLCFFFIFIYICIMTGE